jgi:hypothetical protein
MDLDKIKILTFANNRYLASRENLIRHLSSLGLNNFIKLDESYFSEDFVNENQKILSMRRGFGYWLWKPYIIIEELISEEENIEKLDGNMIFENIIELFVKIR